MLLSLLILTKAKEILLGLLTGINSKYQDNGCEVGGECRVLR
jgi:hypothetical protein